jgi:hypothetical protein
LAYYPSFHYPGVKVFIFPTHPPERGATSLTLGGGRRWVI